MAWHFRRPDVDGFLAELTSAQYTEWVAFLTYFASPLERGIARLQATIHNAWGGSGRPASERDYLPLHQRRGETPEESGGFFTRMFRGIAQRLGGTRDAGH